MKALLAFTVLLLSPVITSGALAQSAGVQAGAVGGQKPVTSEEPSNSFAALPPILKVGQEVKVRQDAGRATRGKVVSISDNQLVIMTERRFFRSPVELAFTEDSVRAIDAVDSIWNGFLIGGAIGFGAVAASDRICCPRSDGVAAMFWTPLFAAAGGLIDYSHNKTIYDSGSQRSRVDIAPWIERDRKGIVFQVCF